MRAFVLLLAITGAVAAADDDDKTKEKPATPPAKVDWGAFTDASTLAGTVEKVGETGMTLKVVKRIYGRPPRPEYEEIELQYHDSVQVRWPKPPPRLDAAGKKTQYTPKEMAALKLPQGAPGYAADKSDVAEGATVQVQLMRPKGVAPSKLVTGDYRVKYVVIVSPAGAMGKK